MNKLEIYSIQNFESIKHIDENGIEYWYARELQLVLNYKEWRKFEGVIIRAKKACQNSNVSILDHFVDIDKMVQISSGAERMQKDYKLTRYACYLRLRYREDILDNMGSDELIANLFRISQTEQKLKRDNTKTEAEANKTHYTIGKNIREVIAKNGGTMPEDLPTPKKSLKELEKENKKNLIKQ